MYKVSDSKILLERQSIWFIANLNWRRLSINFGTPSMYVTGKIINALYLSLSSLHFSQFWYSDLESGKWGRGRGKTGRGNNPGHGEKCFTVIVISFISQNTCFSPNNNENSSSAAHRFYFTDDSLLRNPGAWQRGRRTFIGWWRRGPRRSLVGNTRGRPRYSRLFQGCTWIMQSGSKT